MSYVKDLTTKAALLSGQSNDGLYVLFESSATTIPQAYWSLYVLPLLICGIVDWVILFLVF